MADHDLIGGAVPQLQTLVAEFHRAFGCDTDVPLASAPDELIYLRIDLIQEESTEVFDALRGGDQLAMARELADLAYVTYGTAVAFGLTVPDIQVTRRALVAECGKTCVAIALRSSQLATELGALACTIRNYAQACGVDLDTAVAEVHRANLAKIGPGGRPIIRADGKIMKPESWQPPDMRCAVVGIRERAIRDDFTVPVGANPGQPPYWLDGIQEARWTI